MDDRHGGFRDGGSPRGQPYDERAFHDRDREIRDRRREDRGPDQGFPVDDDELFESGRAGLNIRGPPPGGDAPPPARRPDGNLIRPSAASDPDSRKPDGTLRWQKHLKKTRICKFWLERNGDCPFGANCNFAHGEQDLERPKPPSPNLLLERQMNRPPAYGPGDLGTPRADGFQRRMGFDKSRFDEPAPSPRVVESSQPPPPPAPAPPNDEDDAWSEGSLEAEDDLGAIAKRPRLAA